MDFLNSRMEEAKQNGLKRDLKTFCGRDFISNDYLGLRSDRSFNKVLKDAVLRFEGTLAGSGGSRLLGGHSDFCEAVEVRLAAFSQSEGALFFPSGYQANVALLSSLVGKGDVVLSDEYNHASLIDGIKLCKGDKVVYRHSDVLELETRLQECQERYNNIFIVCESIYSMEGDHTPLKKISELAESYGANVIVDESHATGLFGPGGSGMVNELGLRGRTFCTIHTAGKALGVGGAWIAGKDTLRKYLIHFSRGFIYSTAPSPVQFLFVDESIGYLKNIPHRSQAVLSGARWMREKLGGYPVKVLGQNSPIVPIVLGDHQKVMKVSSRLKEKGFDVAAIRYPTVPEGQARLRISMNNNNVGRASAELLDALVPIMGDIL